MFISVIICTHNPREDYLRRTLDALNKQTLPKDQWELLLIDNASKEPLAGKWDLSWHPKGRHILEEELGLTPARLRGIRESKADLIVFIDDDNILESHYLERSLKIAETHPHLGVWGAGRLVPEFEVQPETPLLPYLSLLALRTVEKSAWTKDPTDPFTTPWGAGLVVRRFIATEYNVQFQKCSLRRSLDRKGQSLVSGGDDEFSRVACSLGTWKGLFVELEITHLISAGRIEESYLLRMAEGNAYSSYLMQRIHGDEPCKINDKPALWRVALELVRLRRSLVYYEWQRWRQSRASTLNNRFVNARKQGIKRACRDLKSPDFRNALTKSGAA